MKVVLYMAMSVNGMIDAEGGDEDFLSHENWLTFEQLAEKYGNFIVGRKTFDAVKNWGADYSFDTIRAERIIVSSNSTLNAGKGYIVVSSPKDAVQVLEKKGFETALLTGGATINASFFKERLVDEVIVNVEPALVGKGIPLVAPADFEYRLELLKIDQLKDGIVQLHYRVQK